MVRGMSTRRGEVVLLHDVLDEAKARRVINCSAHAHTCLQDRMAQLIAGSAAKAQQVTDVNQAAEAIGLAAIVVQDLRARSIRVGGMR